MALRDKGPVLLIVDIQQGFEDVAYWGGNRNNLSAEAQVGSILDRWRRLGLPVIHVWHSSSNLQSPLHKTHKGFMVHPAVAPQGDEPVLTKQVNSAFIGTDLHQRLVELEASTVVVVGLTTDHCISTTVRMAGNFGFDTMVVSDATATFDKIDDHGKLWSADIVHDVHLASLKDEFAEIISTEILLDRL